MLLRPSPIPKETKIGIIYSSCTKTALISIGVDYDEYIGYVKFTFGELDIEYEIVEEGILEEDDAIKKLSKYKILILPNMCFMSKKQVENIIEYVKRGGKVFATYTTSFRTEKDEYLDPRDFQLGSLFGIKFISWVAVPPKCHYMKKSVEHTIWRDLPKYLRVFRYTTMVVSAAVENTVAVWYDEDKTTPSFSQDQNASIVVTKNTIPSRRFVCT